MNLKSRLSKKLFIWSLFAFLSTISYGQQNIIRDSGLVLDNGTISTEWESFVFSGSATIEADEGAVKISEIQNVREFYDLGFYQIFNQSQIDSIYPGAYKITFDAKTYSSPKSVGVYFGNNGTDGDWTNWAQFVDVDNQWETYSLYATATQNWSQMRFGFDLGADTSSIWLDNVFLSRVNESPLPPAPINLSTTNGVVTISVTPIEGAASYDVYFSETQISDPMQALLVGSIDPDEGVTLEHSTFAPHHLLAKPFTAYYAVVAKSEVGTMGELSQRSIVTDMKVRESYMAGLLDEHANAIFTQVVNDQMPDSDAMMEYFPKGYVPFEINQSNFSQQAGDGVDGDEDLSGKFWMGYETFTGADFLILYAEISDNVLRFAPTIGQNPAGLAWNYDSWDIGIGAYSPESFIEGSDHQDFEYGEEPDYQIRMGLFNDNSTFVYAFTGVGGLLDQIVPNSITLGETTDTGYRLLTVLSTIELSRIQTENKDFVFPKGDQFTTVPLNIALNDNDDVARDNQLGWSAKATVDWWKSPNEWETVAMVGSDNIYNSLLVPEPPYAVGDTINYNGSFANSELGAKSNYNQGWYFENANGGTSTYEIINEAQDGDERAAKVSVVYDGNLAHWTTQLVNDPINVAEGDLIGASFWAKAEDENRKAEFFFGLTEAGNYVEVQSQEITLSTSWNQYMITYLVTETDAETGMRFGFNLNYSENVNAEIYFDNLQIVKQLLNRTEVDFSVNLAIQKDLLNFDPTLQSVGVVGAFNNWNIEEPILMEMENDSIYTGSLSLIEARLSDTLAYKFILKDNSSGVIEWESPEQGSPNTIGFYNNRFFVVDDLDLVSTPTVYFHNIERDDQHPENYGIATIIDVRTEPSNTHLAIRGIVTKTTTNWVFIQDETAATMAFSRPYFSDMNAISFNNAVNNLEIRVGDEIKVSAMTAEYSGLHELVRMHGWDIVSRDNPLPAAQTISIPDLNTQGEAYESELVSIHDIHFIDQVDTLDGGQYYLISDETETDLAYLYIPEAANTYWADHPAPIGTFSFEGIVKEQYNSEIEGNVYAIVPLEPEDIQGDSSYFPANFELPLISGLVGNTFAYPISLTQLGGVMEGFRFKLLYDPAVISLTVDEDQSGTLVDGITLEVNDETPGELYIGGIDANGITGTGRLLNLSVELLSFGYSNIHMNEVEINEQGIANEPLGAVNVVLRLCGDVTGDGSISASDAVAVLRHSVRLEPEYPLAGLDSTAADVTGNGVITPFDASRILQYEVQLIDHLSCVAQPLKGEPQVTQAGWEIGEQDDAETRIEVDFSSSDFDIYAVQLSLDLSEGLGMAYVSNLPENWMVIQHKTQGKMLVSAYGVTPLIDKKLAVHMNTSLLNGQGKVSGELMLNESASRHLEELVVGDAPSELMLDQNYPNPFNPATNISYSLPNKAMAELSVYNMLGQRVASLVNTNQDAGSYTVTWRADNLSSGVYIYRLTVDNQTVTKRMMLVK